VEGRRATIDHDRFWKALADCLLTTQQRSGPDSAVARFIRTAPYPLTLSACLATAQPSAYATEVLTRFGGIRRASTIGRELEENLLWLRSNGGWSVIDRVLDRLQQPHGPKDEREAAEVLAEHLLGLGPKQSRNVLQTLGLTQHEVPLDSRLAKWLNDFGFPLRLSAVALSDPGYYGLVSDSFQALCEAAGVSPCLMDAAIFASFDRPWNADEVIW
jgi:hypothetical protein